jgi:hypothetical protein
MTMLAQLGARYSGLVDTAPLNSGLQDASVDYEKYESQLLASTSLWL